MKKTSFVCGIVLHFFFTFFLAILFWIICLTLNWNYKLMFLTFRSIFSLIPILTAFLTITFSCVFYSKISPTHFVLVSSLSCCYFLASNEWMVLDVHTLKQKKHIKQTNKQKQKNMQTYKQANKQTTCKHTNKQTNIQNWRYYRSVPPGNFFVKYILNSNSNKH